MGHLCTARHGAIMQNKQSHDCSEDVLWLLPTKSILRAESPAAQDRAWLRMSHRRRERSDPTRDLRPSPAGRELEDPNTRKVGWIQHRFSPSERVQAEHGSREGTADGWHDGQFVSPASTVVFLRPLADSQSIPAALAPQADLDWALGE